MTRPLNRRPLSPLFTVSVKGHPDVTCHYVDAVKAYRNTIEKFGRESVRFFAAKEKR